ncbi:pirin family protein [Shewanella sp. GXUN23E]|uniref:pirin family protein n=1 Tax=Shewanella sp. GXUN23E TaxID=3422498 RepID=UPI003D7EDFE7
MKVLKVFESSPAQDGDGVRISRVADFSGKLLDPFLMIDELKSEDKSDFIGGFPPHPHRGIETFTYILKGGFEHRDQLGNCKHINAGDVQWMSTGFGMVHSEMPLADHDGMHGFQIWVNMPAKDKLRPPRYADSVADKSPELTDDAGSRLRILAGRWTLAEQTAVSPIGPLAAEASIADLTMTAGNLVTLDLSHHQQAFVYLYRGRLSGYVAGQLLLLDPAYPIELQTEDDCGLLIFSGNRIAEPVAHMGPFVMNTPAELMQAVQDYQAGKFGSIG